MDGLTSPVGLLPAETPLPMPARPLSSMPPRSQARPVAPPGTRCGRLLVLAVTATVTVVATLEMWEVLGLARWTASGVLMTILFAVLLMPIALSFATALLGFLVLLQRRPHDAVLVPDAARTALLMPICSEDVSEMEWRLATMRSDLHANDVDQAFDIFVLSDSRDKDLIATERNAVLRLRRGAGCRVFYRNRAENDGRKAGNIAEWVRRFGGAYDTFVVLDADSLMRAGTLRSLVAAMHADTSAGLLQTVPVLQGGRTIFAKLQVFASQVYGPVLAAGAAAWHGADGNYWGHNAIIRTAAFAEACGLPVLPGRKPFGGEVMSHDFVEAALLRRAGWAVRLLPHIGGSFEGGPPTLTELDARDRRWCQGNIQHAAIIGATGLHPVSRLHLALGIGSYLSAALWMLFLVLGIVVSLQARFLRPEYFPQTHVLFPQWPVVDAQRAVWVFAATMGLLLAPKLLGILTVALSHRRPTSLGAWARLLCGALFEILISAIISPATMVRQAGHVIAVLAGRDSGWKQQCRADTTLPFSEALQFARISVVLGLLMLAASLAVDPWLAGWMSPVIIGLLLSPIVIWLTAQRAERFGWTD